MTLPSSGQLSLKDILDEKQGATTAQINISLKGLSVDGVDDYSGVDHTGSPNQSEPYQVSEFYGYSASAFPSGSDSSKDWFEDALGSEKPTFIWGNNTRTGSEFSVQVTCQVAFKKDTTNDRIIMQEGNGNSGTGTSLSLHYLSYSGHDSTTFQAKCVYTTSASSGSGISSNNPASYSPASNTYATLSTSSFSPNWFWSLTNTGFSPATLTSSSPHPLWTLRVGSGASDPTIDGPTGGNAISMSAQRGQSGGAPGPVCIHEDHKISTQDGLLTIQELIDTCPKVWSWNNEKQEKELVDVAIIEKRSHNNLWKVNNFKLTEDHIVYVEGYLPKAIRPDLAMTATDVENVEHLVVGDKVMLEDGTTEGITTIVEHPGDYETYTVGNPNGNFYADGFLVDSEVRIPPQGTL